MTREELYGGERISLGALNTNTAKALKAAFKGIPTTTLLRACGSAGLLKIPGIGQKRVREIFHVIYLTEEKSAHAARWMG